MSSFDSTKQSLGKVLDSIVEGKIQLPDFQRGWVWDDTHIRSLLVSIARSFPIGSIMLLETGGEAKFQIRPIEGVSLPSGVNGAEQLILDGQQRLTSLTQVLKMEKAVQTKDDQRREVERFYYFIDPGLLRVDDFRAFYEARKKALIGHVERAMGKDAVAHSPQPAPEDEWEDEESEEQNG